MFRPVTSRKSISLSACALGLVTATTGNFVRADVQYNTIALTGAAGTAAGLGPNLGAGTNFAGFFNPPTINSSGQLAFTAVLSGDGATGFGNRGIFTYGVGAGAGITPVARGGPLGPGPNMGAGIEFGSMSGDEVVINDAGRVAFETGITGTGVTASTDEAIFRNSSGTLAAIARDGTAGSGLGPNLGSTAKFNMVSTLATSMNPSGVVTFKSNLTDPSGSAVFINSGGSNVAVARSGSSGSGMGPNLGAGVSFNTFGGSEPAINASGRVAFRATLTGTGVDSTNNDAIFTNIGGVSTAVARTGGAGPNAGVTFTSLLAKPAINNAGDLAFYAELGGSPINGTLQTAIVKHTSGVGLSTVARNGVAAPANAGAGATFTSVTAPNINGAGDVAFYGSLSTGQNGLFTNIGGVTQTAARSGVAGPGLGPDLGAGIEFVSFGSMALNGNGELAFIGNLVGGGVSDPNNEGLFAYVDSAVQLVVRNGDMYDVDPGPGTDNRHITGVSFYSLSNASTSNGEDGRQRVFNDDGMISFGLSFDDASWGIFTATVRPTPAAWNGGSSGNWNDSANWNGGILPSSSRVVTLPSASAGLTTITLSADAAARSLKFDGDYTLTGGTLTTPAIEVAVAKSATIASVVQGSAGLTKTGAGTLTLSGANTFAGGTKVSAGTVVATHADAFAGGAVDVANGATAKLQASLPKAATVTTLSTNTSGKFDVTNNAMVIKGMSVAQVQAEIGKAFNAGKWNGAAGLTSSTAATSSPKVMAIGFASNSVLNKSDFKGVTGLSGSDILVKYTYYGDSDLSGVTDLADFTRFVTGLRSGGTTWVEGDYDYSGGVTLDDFSMFLLGFQQQGTPMSELAGEIDSTPMGAAERAAMLAAVQAVPEPVGLGVLGLVTAGVLGGRRRRTARR